MAQETTKSQGMPYSSEAELAVIGAIFYNPECIPEFLDKINPEYFYIKKHRMIVEAMLDLAFNNIPPDIVSCGETLKSKGMDLQTGDYYVLKEFLQFASSSSNIPHWLDEIKRYWELRTIVEKCSDIAIRGKRVAGADVGDFLTEAEQTFMALSEARTSIGMFSSEVVVKEVLHDLEKLVENPGTTAGVHSGFRDLDEITGGFQPSDLIILAARPAMGKTSFALNIAAHAAIGAGKYTAVFSLEMSRHQLMHRLLSTAARVNAHKFRDGKLTSEDFEKLYDNIKSFHTDKLMLDDTSGISILELASRVRKMKREKKAVDLIIVDYLQLMTAGSAAITKSGSREREISFISSGLKGLAKEMNCPVIALSQLNRGVEKQQDKRPRASDLRESGSIEQDADLILFIYRDEVYNKSSPDKGIAEIIIGKNRHGPIDTAKLAFHSEFTSFHNLAKYAL